MDESQSLFGRFIHGSTDCDIIPRLSQIKCGTWSEIDNHLNVKSDNEMENTGIDVGSFVGKYIELVSLVHTYQDGLSDLPKMYNQKKSRLT